MKARTVVGRGEKSLLCEPGSELRVGSRERRRCAKIINGMSKKKKKKKKKNRHGHRLCWMWTGRKNGSMRRKDTHSYRTAVQLLQLFCISATAYCTERHDVPGTWYIFF